MYSLILFFESFNMFLTSSNCWRALTSSSLILPSASSELSNLSSILANLTLNPSISWVNLEYANVLFPVWEIKTL